MILSVVLVISSVVREYAFNYTFNYQLFRISSAISPFPIVLLFSAYLNGVKANYGTIGVNAKVPRRDCEAGNIKAHHTQSIAQWALKAGKSIGLVTTTRGKSPINRISRDLSYQSNSFFFSFQFLVTHASPAGVCLFVAHFKNVIILLFTLLFHFLFKTTVFHSFI